MNYCYVTVILAFKNLKTYENEFTAFSLEDTEELIATRQFISTLKSNEKYEILGVEYEVEKMNFTDPTDPKIVNTIH